jgi:hypothetical protein
MERTDGRTKRQTGRLTHRQWEGEKEREREQGFRHITSIRERDTVVDYTVIVCV